MTCTYTRKVSCNCRTSLGMEGNGSGVQPCTSMHEHLEGNLLRGGSFWVFLFGMHICLSRETNLRYIIHNKHEVWSHFIGNTNFVLRALNDFPSWTYRDLKHCVWVSNLGKKEENLTYRFVMIYVCSNMQGQRLKAFTNAIAFEM